MIYLDNAATTMRKPPGVTRAISDASKSFGGPGRGSHGAAMRAADAVYACREAACELFGIKTPESVILTMNATHSLNIAIKSLAIPGGKVLVSGFEHNAVMRPLNALEAKGVKHEVVNTPLFDPEKTCTAFENALDDDVNLVVCTHVSNVFGYILPIERIAELCRRKGVTLIIDAAQSAGVLPVNAEHLSGAVLCMPGHKGLYGPQGTGLLIVPEGVTLTSLTEGGTGSNSLSLDMPQDMPDMLEAGTPNAWGAAGLYEGIKFVTGTGTEEIAKRERELLSLCAGYLYGINGVKFWYAPDVQTGVISMIFDGKDSEDVAALLNDKGIAVRAGLQCAPTAHDTVGTLPYGTLRVSFSYFTTPGEIRQFADILRRIV